ncbi:TPA: recombination protein RecR [Legionella pneumophila]|uniref:Recombination protein RecR n=2 Tax=Legionella pneumophila TaxID=446 RepID=A0A2S6EU55_LEGPN|nr:recombination protein RecR [Legionella pneumophila]TIH01435.1 recombination protein RecR [Legionella pneumophila]HAT6362387.1 recombination protein RecR [Legionella pneumophila]HAT6365440.1 recombination protein RecR [Legionella pneumophila]HAT6369352.1 recombination protein RecR [Legionella pneumophila]
MAMDALSRLVEALRCLPGVGPKSAQRMVFHLLQHQRQRGLHLASCLEQAMKHISHCQQCNNYTEQALCALCQNPNRDSTLLCVVESPADVSAIEQSNSFQGKYFVLMGKISPLDGLGPDDIGLPKLKELIIREKIQEVILALSPSVESQTTIHFIHQLLKSETVNISQLAHGIPSGGELEFLDGNTISSALKNRAVINV